MEVLSAKELTIAKLAHEGKNNREIGTAMQCSENYIRNRMRLVFDKTGMNSRLELALWYEVHHCDGKCLENSLAGRGDE